MAACIAANVKFIINLISTVLCATIPQPKSLKLLKTLGQKIKIHNMFRPIWPSSGVKMFCWGNCCFGCCCCYISPRMHTYVVVSASSFLSWLRCVSLLECLKSATGCYNTILQCEITVTCIQIIITFQISVAPQSLRTGLMFIWHFWLGMTSGINWS
jgi:hypothetical protein